MEMEYDIRINHCKNCGNADFVGFSKMYNGRVAGIKYICSNCWFLQKAFFCNTEQVETDNIPNFIRGEILHGNECCGKRKK